jgi:hypothetical protein
MLSVEISQCERIPFVYNNRLVARSPLPTTRTLNQLMQGGHRGNTGARRGHLSRFPSTPYSHPPPEERRARVYNTRSGSIPQNLARSDVLLPPNPPTQSTSQPSPSNNLPVWPQFFVVDVLILPYLQENAAAQRPSTRLISQTPYVPSRARGEFVVADPISFSVNGIPGITIAQAVAGECAGLDGKDDGIPAFGKSKILCRIQVGTAILRTCIPPTSL